MADDETPTKVIDLFTRRAHDTDEPVVDEKAVGRLESQLIEFFRKALMVAHHHDWEMETVSEAAHVCGRALVADILASERGE